MNYYELLWIVMNYYELLRIITNCEFFVYYKNDWLQNKNKILTFEFLYPIYKN